MTAILPGPACRSQMKMSQLKAEDHLIDSEEVQRNSQPTDHESANLDLSVFLPQSAL